MLRALLAAVAFVIAAASLAPAGVSAEPAAWLFVSDLHVDPAARTTRIPGVAEDSNWALIDSTLAAMRRAEPNPPVIVLGGDFLAHGAQPRQLRAVMDELARRFDRAFPRAQFVLVLGNIDSECGDYAAPGTTLLQAVARAWAPLVNRHGAAPHFVTTFARDGFYTTALPRFGLRAVVVDDVSWSVRYRGGCGAPRGAGRRMRDELRAGARARSGESRWILFHVPPGIDAFSTAHLAHGLAVVPFLDPEARDALLAAITAPDDRVALAVAGHTHKFGFRIAGAGTPAAVPIVLVPSVSPIFGNGPSFLTVDVAANGSVVDVRETSLVGGRWRRIGGLRDLGMAALSAKDLGTFAERLAHDPDLRSRFARLYNGGLTGEITEGNWHVYACAIRAYSATQIRTCLNQGGFSLLTQRGVIFVAVAGVAFASVVAVVITTIVLSRRRRNARDA